MRGKPFKEGNKAASGRGPNKVTRTVKEHVLDTFLELQADPDFNMLAWAKANLTEFYKVASKLIPTELTGDVAVPTIRVIREDKDEDLRKVS